MLPNEPSPIVVIKRKELELSDRLELARRAAAAEIQSERQAAAEARARAEEEGRAQAEQYYRAQLEGAESEARQIESDGESAAARIVERGQRRMPEAVGRILAAVLPPVALAQPSPLDVAVRAE